GQPGRIGGRMPHVPPADPADVAVCPGTEPPPVVTAPVAQVVPAAMCFAAGPVADLVRSQPGPGEQVLGQQVLVGQVVVVRQRQFTAPDPGGEPGALLHDQGVRADVVGFGAQRGLQADPPV